MRWELGWWEGEMGGARVVGGVRWELGWWDGEMGGSYGGGRVRWVGATVVGG